MNNSWFLDVTIDAKLTIFDVCGGPGNTYALFIYLFMYLFFTFSQLAITCSKLTIEKLEQGVKYVQS